MVIVNRILRPHRLFQIKTVYQQVKNECENKVNLFEVWPGPFAETPQALTLRDVWETEAGARAEDPVCPCSP
jgi:hypothetical protein